MNRMTLRKMGMPMRAGGMIILLLFAASAFGESAGRAPEVAIEFVVRAPDGTPLGETLYVVGNLRALGTWSPTGLALKKGEDGLHRATAHVPAGTTLQFKITQGSWETVEKGAEGQEIPNREFVAEENASIEIEVASWATGGSAPARKSTITGDVRLHERFRSEILDNERSLRVYLPAGYQKSDERYPVLYLHDGQNLFDCATAAFGVEWGADEAAERLIETGRIRPIIIVGIDNNRQRMSEYTPWPRNEGGVGGRGDDYARFLFEEVKPFIDRTYRSLPGREHTAVAGSSLGGLISLHIARRHNEKVSLCGAMSPTLWWGGDRLFEELERDPDGLRKVKFWIDMGTREGRSSGNKDEPSSAIRGARRLAELFNRAGLKAERDYRYEEAEGALHNEAAWAKRFGPMLLFFFGNGENNEG